MTKPYTGNRPDKLSRHGSCSTHLQNQLAYQEWQTRLATGSTVADMVERSSILTVDDSQLASNDIVFHTKEDGDND